MRRVLWLGWGCLFLGACNAQNQKLGQCQQIITIADRVVQEARPLREAQGNSNMDRWLQAAGTMEQGSRDLRNLTLQDETLRGYRDRLAQTYQDYAQATYDILKAQQTQDRPKALAAQNLVKKASDREKTVGQEMNTYCQPNP